MNFLYKPPALWLGRFYADHPEFTAWLADNGFFTAPASANHHGNHDGDLFAHSLAVTQVLVDLTERLSLSWGHKDSPYVVGFFHDLCKIDAYRKTDAGWEWNPKQGMPGHGEKSVILLQRFVQLTDEEIACIRWHMGAFDDKENWQFYSRAVKKYPNVLWTHTADMVASQIQGV